MSRGNQREIDRAKAQARTQAKLKQAAKGGDIMKKNENDASALQAKVAAKKAQQEAQDLADAAAGPAKAPVVRKKVPKVMDDLLSAGLPATKKRVK